MNGDKDFSIISNGATGSSGSSSSLKQQKFVSSGQTEFIVTNFNLNDNYIVFVDGVLQSFGHTRNGNIVTFDYLIPEGTEVIIIN